MFALGVGVAAFACAGDRNAPAKHNDARAEESSALTLPAVTELVPAAGLRWMIVAEPRKIWGIPELARGLGELVPNQRLDAFSRDTGVDLRALSLGVIAGFDLGVLYLGELPERSSSPLELFTNRLAGNEVVERPHPRVRRVTGTLEGIPYGFLDLDGRIVGVAARDLTLSRIPIAFALGRLKRTPPALKGAALSTLPALNPRALVTFFAPGPFEDEWAGAANGILSAALAVAIQIEPVGEDLRATLVVSGDWQNGGQAAVDELVHAFADLARSSTGKLFALERAHEISGSFHPQYLTLSAELPLDPLVRGLRAAVMADVWEILDLPHPEDVRDAGSDSGSETFP